MFKNIFKKKGKGPKGTTKNQNDNNTETKNKFKIDPKDIKLAEEWKDKKIQISGVGGRIRVNLNDGSVFTGYGGAEKGISDTFIIRTFSDFPGIVAFEVDTTAQATGEAEAEAEAEIEIEGGYEENSNNNKTPSTTEAATTAETKKKFLTVQMYGDENRRQAAALLAAIPDLIAEHIPLIVDYAIGRPTEESNFEGAGFNYSPMNATSGTGRNGAMPTKLQLFTLVEPNPRRNHYQFGVKSLFERYWRSQHWEHTVSQSSHLLGDETWSFHRIMQ